MERRTIITADTETRDKEGWQGAGPSVHPSPPGFTQTLSLAAHALPESLPSTKYSFVEDVLMVTRERCVFDPYCSLRAKPARPPRQLFLPEVQFLTPSAT